MFCSGPTDRKCRLCEKPIDVMDPKVTIESNDMHKACFTCAICDVPLKINNSQTDHVLKKQFGLMYFCGKHGLMSPAEKMEMLKQRFPVLAEQQE